MQRMQHRFSLIRVFTLLALGASVSACSTLTSNTPVVDSNWAPVVKSKQSELMENLLSAEFALQRQGSAAAAELYLAAAQSSDDKQVAQRATATAMMSESNQAVLAASERWLTLDPNNTDIYPVRLQALLLTKQVEAAQRLLEQASANKIELSFLPNFVDQNVRNHNITTGLEGILGAETLQDDIFVEVAQYHLLFISGEYPYLVENVPSLMERSPKSELEGLTIIKAYSEEQLGFKKKAQQTLENGLRRFPNSQRILANLLEVLIKNDKTQQALDKFKNAQFPAYLQQQIGLSIAQQMIQQGELKLSEELLYDLPRYGNLRDDLLFMTANVQQQLGKYDKALQNLINVFGHLSWDASELLVKWLYDANQEEQINSLILKRAAVDSEPGHITGVADLHLSQQRSDLAINLLTRSLPIFPKEDGLRYKRAITYDMLGEWPKAIADLKVLKQQKPNDPSYLNALGYTMMVRSPKDFDEAFDLVQKAYALDDQDPAILDSMGWGYYLKGDTDNALDLLAQAWSEMQDAEIGAHYGEVLWQLSEKAQAVTVWQQSLEDNNQLPVLLKTIKRYAPELLTGV